MTAGDIISQNARQLRGDKLTGAGKTLTAGTFCNFDTSDPRKLVQSVADEVAPCFGVVPKNISGEAIGQTTPSLLVYGDNDAEASYLVAGVMAMLTTNGVTYQTGMRVKVGTGGLPVLFVEGTDEFRDVKGVVRGSKVVGDGTNTVQIEIGVIN